MFNRPTPALRLRQPVGNGMANDPDDVMAVQRRLGAQGLYTWDDDGPSGFIDRDLLAGIRKFQHGKGLAVDGWLAPGGETERNLNRPPDRTSDFNPYLEHAEPVDIAGEVGNGRANDEADVTGVKRALSALGHYQYDLTSDPSPFIDRAMLDGIKTFQQQNGLKVDGWLGRGGETQAAMNAALASQTPEQAPPARPSRNLLAVDDGSSGESIDMNDRPVQVAQAKRRGIIGAVGNALRDLVMPPPPPSPPKPVESPKPTQTPVPDSNSETKPVVPDDGKRDPFFDQLGIYAQEEMKKRPGRWGNEDTKWTTDTFVEECEKTLDEDFPHLREFVRRSGGGQLDTDEKRMRERYIRGLDAPEGSTKDSSYADMSYEAVDKNGKRMFEAHNNTTSTRADGTMTKDEQWRFEKLMRNAGGRFVRAIAKKDRRHSEDNVRKEARRACEDMFGEMEDELKVRGYLPADEQPEADNDHKE